MSSLRRAAFWAPFTLVPLALLLKLLEAQPGLVFLSAGAALLPLAGLMGKATEHLAGRVGTGPGALINASFGNAAELILAFAALREGLTDVVKASLTGSIIGNCLLILGLSILAGGIRHPRQEFNPTTAGVGSTLLALSATALVLPAAFHHLVPAAGFSEERLSLAISGILLGAYGLSLLFTLRTHKHLYAFQEAHLEGTPWSLRRATGILALATALVVMLSEILVGEVEPISKQFGLNQVFLGVMLLAFLGNAAEHSSAVLMAVRNRMDLAIGISIGSSVQIALFVAPVLVFASLGMGRRLDLVFSACEVLAVAISAWIVSLVAHDGESHWLEGVLLLAVYAILGVTFYYLPG